MDTDIFEESVSAEVMDALRRIRDLKRQALDARAGALIVQQQACTEAFKLLWFSGMTAQLLTRMGKLAAANFQAHADMVSYLLAAGVELHPHEYTPPKDMPYTVHADGTITLD